MLIFKISGLNNFIDINEITGKVIRLSLKVHSSLGPGLLENSYKECLFYELGKNGLFAEKEKALPLVYNEVRLDIGTDLIFL